MTRICGQRIAAPRQNLKFQDSRLTVNLAVGMFIPAVRPQPACHPCVVRHSALGLITYIPAITLAPLALWR
jgi:hypothetical protein